MLPRAAKAGIRVDVLVRSKEGRGADAVRALGAFVVEGDIAAMPEDELAAIFANYDTVLSCVGFAAQRARR